MSPKPHLYQVKGLVFRYGERFELNIPDFSIEPGSAVGLIGPNGGGKTTLLRILAFIERPQGGEILFDGERTRVEDAPLTRSVSMLLQEPYLLKRSVFENVAYGLKVRGERKRLKQKVEEALGTVGLDFQDFSRRSWYELSGGEAQRVALAARLILKPRVLILDEPTASVDEKSALLIKDAVIESRSKDGTTLIIASHDHFWLNSITTDIRRVYRGRVLGKAVRNVIIGPWVDIGEGLCRTTLPDGQPVVGSLLLGLYDEQGQLHHVGVAASFSAAKRLELTETLATHAATDEHPWLAWAQAHGGRIPGVQSRWSAGKDLSFVPTNPDLVAEVKYDHMEGSRFRHVTKLLRLRPDRDPDSCTYEQLETPVRFDLSEVLPGL